MNRRPHHRLRTPPAAVLAIIAAVALLGGPRVGPAFGQVAGEYDERVAVQLLAINDFHGALEPRTVALRPAGGAAALSGYLNALEAEARAAGAETVRVAAGDLIGGSPPLAGLLRDEPAIAVMGALNLRYSAVGNHEFDRGLAELRRLHDGGCHPAGGCFSGGRFQYLAANVVDAVSGEPVFPPYAVERVRGARIGFIGVVLESAPSLLNPSAAAGLRFLPEVATVNRYTAELVAQGVRAIVVLLHEGGAVGGGGSPARSCLWLRRSTPRWTWSSAVTPIAVTRRPLRVSWSRRRSHTVPPWPTSIWWSTGARAISWRSRHRSSPRTRMSHLARTRIRA